MSLHVYCSLDSRVNVIPTYLNRIEYEPTCFHRPLDWPCWLRKFAEVNFTIHTQFYSHRDRDFDAHGKAHGYMTQTSTDTPTQTSTDTPTHTPDPTPSPADEAIEAARDGLRTILEEATGSQTGSLLSVNASTDYDDRGVQTALADSQSRLNEARDRASTSAQAATISDLTTIWQFFRLVDIAQEATVNAHDQLLNEVLEALDNESSPDARDAMNQVGATVDKIDPPIDDMNDEVDPAAFDALEALPRSAYDEKINQLRDEEAVYQDLENDEMMPRFREGIDHLDTARARERAQEWERAENEAEDARRILSEVEETFDDYRDDGLPERADGLQNLVEDFRDLAATKEEAAGVIVERAQSAQSN